MLSSLLNSLQDNSELANGFATGSTAQNNTMNNINNMSDEEKAGLFQLLSRQQAIEMNFNTLNHNHNMGGGGLPPQNATSQPENNTMTSTDFAAASNSAAAFQSMNNNMGMHPMMMNPMMNSAMMNNHMMANMGMNGMNMNNFMNFQGMTPHQAILASSGGFNLPIPQPIQEDPGWEEQFFSLQAYQREMGHCKVPARFKSNPKLGRWVMTQRRQFTLLMQGYPSALTAERIQRLEGIGFTWSIRPEPVKTWNRKFQELKVYKDTFGNCMVPQRYQGKKTFGFALTFYLIISCTFYSSTYIL